MTRDATEIGKSLRRCATETWPFAVGASNTGSPATDNNFGRAVALMHEAADELDRLAALHASPVGAEPPSSERMFTTKELVEAVQHAIATARNEWRQGYAEPKSLVALVQEWQAAVAEYEGGQSVRSLLRLPDARAAVLAWTPAQAEPAAPHGWQPMETAPKVDPILVYDEGCITIAMWVDNEEERGWYDHGFIDPPPTHWRPLPDPPATPSARPARPPQE